MAADPGRMRASNAEREQVINILEAAFVDGRLTKDELDARVGQTIAARTHAELATVTVDIPSPPEPVRVVRRHSGNKAAMRAVKAGACAVAAATLAVSVVGGMMAGAAVAVIIAIMMVILGALVTAFVAAVIAAALKLEARHRRRSGGQISPPESGGQASRRSPSAERPAQLPPDDHGQPHTEVARHIPRRVVAFPSAPLVT